jgi:3-dehydroquinate dehydratase
MNTVLVLNGPNLRRLGTREPDVYGAETFEDLAEICRETGRLLDLHVEVRQTDDRPTTGRAHRLGTRGGRRADAHRHQPG